MLFPHRSVLAPTVFLPVSTFLFAQVSPFHKFTAASRRRSYKGQRRLCTDLYSSSSPAIYWKTCPSVVSLCLKSLGPPAFPLEKAGSYLLLIPSAVCDLPALGTPHQREDSEANFLYRLYRMLSDFPQHLLCPLRISGKRPTSTALLFPGPQSLRKELFMPKISAFRSVRSQKTAFCVM